MLGGPCLAMSIHIDTYMDAHRYWYRTVVETIEQYLKTMCVQTFWGEESMPKAHQFAFTTDATGQLNLLQTAGCFNGWCVDNALRSY